MTKVKEKIRAAVICATFAKDNRDENGIINWNFVDSDVCIEFGGDYIDLIGEVIEELAEEIITAKINDKISKLNIKLKDEMSILVEKSA